MGEEWTDRQPPEALASWRRSDAETIDVTFTLPVPLARTLLDALTVALTVADSSEPPTFDIEEDEPND
jgi:hypothetical protein